MDLGERAELDLEREREQSGDFSGELVTLLDPAGIAAEAYRTLRTNLFYALIDNPPKVVMVTSPGPGEGKSTTSANLGVVLAQADKNTLVIDCDLRKPHLHHYFGLRNLRGLVDTLSKGGEFYQEPVDGLKVLSSGLVPANPAELLGSRRFAEFLGRVREEFDYVILDTSPVEMVSDPLILATQADGVLLVVNARKTRKGSVRRTMSSLEAVEANLIGTVMNGVEASKRGYYGHSRYTYG